MKNKLKNISLFFVFSLISFFIVPNFIKAYDYDIKKYDIEINVNENNSFDIIEKIDTYFYISKHGIIRSLPLKNTIYRNDGSTSKNVAKITNVSVNEKYSTSRENGYYKIKIGDANRTLTGSKSYTIKYTYNIGSDKLKGADELYYNIIGTEWDTKIEGVTFKITLPKEFDENKLGFSVGSSGTQGYDTNKLFYDVDGNTITGYYLGTLNPKQGITIRLELEDGYFTKTTDLTIYLMIGIPLLGLIISFILWFVFGRDEKVIETVEFYPPEGFNSLEIGYLYKGKADNKDVVSLLIYLANQGYIKIEEYETKSLFSKNKDFKIIKLKDYDGNNEDEKTFLKGLFTKNMSLKLLMSRFNIEDESVKEENDDRTSVTSSDLENSFYVTMNKILKNINCKTNKKKIFESSTSFKSVMVVLMIIASIITIVSIPTLQYAGFGELGVTLFITLFYVPFYAVGLSNTIPIFFRIVWLGFTIFHSFAFLSAMPFVGAIKEDSNLLIGFIIGIICVIGMIICLKKMPKRTPYGNEMLGKIKGFKHFLEVAEKEKLESLVMQNPTYFYDILPYTYVLGVSDKWIKKFETITIQNPSWYDSPNAFNVVAFGSFITATMASAQSSMSSRPSSSGGSSGGSGSSGGGSSGGGSGGGGGSSW